MRPRSRAVHDRLGGFVGGFGAGLSFATIALTTFLIVAHERALELRALRFTADARALFGGLMLAKVNSRNWGRKRGKGSKRTGNCRWRAGCVNAKARESWKREAESITFWCRGAWRSRSCSRWRRHTMSKTRLFPVPIRFSISGSMKPPSPLRSMPSSSAMTFISRLLGLVREMAIKPTRSAGSNARRTHSGSRSAFRISQRRLFAKIVLDGVVPVFTKS
jgi:hypothetical protein